jgi:opacity protein-like surface antigen
MTNRFATGRARRILLCAALLTVLVPGVASAQIHQVSSSAADAKQTLNFSLGYFALRGLDARSDDDVLLNELQSAQPLLFEVNDFNFVTFGGEYLIGFGGAFEAGVGVGYYQRTVPSVYANLQHSSGSEIEQDLKLRTLPVSFTARFLPLGRGRSIEPYIGGGITAVAWRYSEIGEFVDFDGSIFPARYIANGTAAGPTILGGVRGVAGNWVVGGEVRWNKAEASGLLDEGFLGDKLDLGGWTTNFTFGVRF